MPSQLRGICMPIAFSTNKPAPRKGPADGDVPSHDKIAARGYLELFFSHLPIKVPDDIDLLEPGNVFVKEMRLYRQHNIHGEHQYLVPVHQEKIEQYEAPHNMRFLFNQIGTDPTTAAYREALQLIPCARHNLDLFLAKLQTLPFFIEILSEQPWLEAFDERYFWLYVRAMDNQYHRIPCQRYSPHCWHGFAHPVVTLHFSDHRAQPIHTFKEVPWQDLAP